MSLVTSIIIDVLQLVYSLLDLYKWIIIIGAILSWLVAFNIVNPNNRFVHVIGDFIYRLTEPLLRPIRNKLPLMGGLDLSPLVLICLVWLAQAIVRDIIIKLVM